MQNQTTPKRRINRLPFILLAISLLPSCAALPKSVESPAQMPKAFSEAGEAALAERWWRGFNDPSLDKLIEEALAGNFNFLAVWDRLAQAEAIAKRQGALLLPEIAAEAGSSARKRDDGGGDFSSGGGGSSNGLDLGLVASYEIDLWGRVRSARDAARLDAASSREDAQAAAITLSAEVAGAWYELATAYGQLRLLGEQFETNSRILELVTLRFRRGQVGAADVIRQRQLVESLEGLKKTAEAAAAALNNRLAVLLGRTAGRALYTTNSSPELAELPPIPATGIPAHIIQRRPDVKRAYYGVLAADRRAAAALADRLPRLSIVAEAGASGGNLRDLFDNWALNLAANLLAPLFDAGARKADVERSRAAVSESLNLYGQAIVAALGEVETALAQERRQRELILSLERQLKLSAQVMERTRGSYIKGAADYLRVLEATVTHQSLERDYLDARGGLLGFRINLYRALAGGWEMDAPPPKGLGGVPAGESEGAILIQREEIEKSNEQ
ncbi:MAG: efflux transporter outer membrane subunit [Deltaproteobacteria bacterium]